jgi:hypothetical protein
MIPNIKRYAVLVSPNIAGRGHEPEKMREG